MASEVCLPTYMLAYISPLVSSSFDAEFKQDSSKAHPPLPPNLFGMFTSLAPLIRFMLGLAKASDFAVFQP